jgi:hypothetical protein
MLDTWKKITPGSVIFCNGCGTKIWKHWHMGKQEVTGKREYIYPVMDKCAPCFFNEKGNKLQIRKLTEYEIQNCKSKLSKYLEEFDNSKTQIVSPNKVVLQ